MPGYECNLSQSLHMCLLLSTYISLFFFGPVVQWSRGMDLVTRQRFAEIEGGPVLDRSSTWWSKAAQRQPASEPPSRLTEQDRPVVVTGSDTTAP